MDENGDDQSHKTHKEKNREQGRHGPLEVPKVQTGDQEE